ncbi:MAG: cellulase family glycosylhydrolase [Candidatus Omnitrophica bacterium]|nr:cellulase family glycosylhydrolase [Candidatus Omnitrophota bacterium]
MRLTIYKDSAVVAAYDILNEPQAPSSKVLLELYRRIIASIREVDPNHLIMLEGDRFSTDFSLFKAPLTDNQVFSFHMYTWFSDKRRKLLDRYRRIAEEQAVPMWNGEFGENRYEMLESTVKLFEQSEYDLSGWAFLHGGALNYSLI